MWLIIVPGTRGGSYLECVNEGKVIQSDVIVVVFDITERLLMVLHQLLDLPILPLGRLTRW